MNETPAADIRDKVGHWVQEGLRVLPHLPGLLHGDDAARMAELQRECERLRKELDELRREHERLRIDRDEVTQALGRLMDSVQPINQIAARLGVRRSPFDRESKPPTPPAAAPGHAPAAPTHGPAAPPHGATPPPHGPAPTPAPKSS